MQILACILCADFRMSYVNSSPNGLAWLALLACIRACIFQVCKIRGSEVTGCLYTCIYFKAYALPPTLNWGFGLNGLHIESCLVCLAFVVDYWYVLGLICTWEVLQFVMELTWGSASTVSYITFRPLRPSDWSFSWFEACYDSKGKLSELVPF